MAKANSIITWTLLSDGNLRCDVKGAGSFTTDRSAYSPQVREGFMVNGIKQRLADAAALSRDTKTGQSASPAEKFAAMKALNDHFNSGSTEWRVKGTSTPKDDIPLQAIADVQGTDIVTMRERVARQAEKRGITVERYVAAVVAQSEAVRNRIAEIHSRNAPDDVEVDIDDLDGSDDDAQGDDPDAPDAE